MMLEALVSTVEAMDPTVCVEALASRCIVNSLSCFSGCSAIDWRHSFSSNSSHLFLMQNLHTKYVIITTTTIPPTTPPAIGPAADPEVFCLVAEGLFVRASLPPPMHCVRAHWSQSLPINEHTSPGAQAGHDGGVSGQVAHLLNRFRPIIGKSATTALAIH